MFFRAAEAHCRRAGKAFGVDFPPPGIALPLTRHPPPDTLTFIPEPP
jgi:hypothetical protein